MSFLPSVVHAVYRDEFRIQLTFNDGSTETVDFSEWLEGPIFEPLQDVAYFRRFFIEGGTVSWPNGADIAPETLYDAAAREKRSNKRLQLPGAPRRARRNREAVRRRARG